MLHRHDYALGARRQVHGAAHVSDAPLRQHPVRQVAALRHLHRAQNRHVYMPAPYHGEPLGRVEVRHTRIQRQELPARVDEVNVLLPRLRHRPVPQHAALAVVRHAPPLGDELRTQRRYPDAQVHHVAVLEFPRHPHRYDFPVESLFFQFAAPSLSSRFCPRTARAYAPRPGQSRPAPLSPPPP